MDCHVMYCTHYDELHDTACTNRFLKPEHCETRRRYEAYEGLVKRIEDRMKECCCNAGGYGAGGFCKQPCDACDKDMEALKKAKGE